MATLYYTTAPELTSVAHAIRQRAGIDEALTYPDEFITAIGAIPAPELQPRDVNFYDFDGRVVDAYSAEEFAALDALPPVPAHEGLTAQGWNWTLSAAKAYAALFGACEIGAMYVTDDGDTRAVVDVGASCRNKVYVRFNASAAGVSVDFGDGTEPVSAASGDNALAHTYAEAGRYTIRLSVPGGATVALGTNALSSYYGAAAFIGQGSGDSGSACLQALYIGSGVTAMKTNALDLATNLREITIPETVTALGRNAFEACMKLKALVLPKGLTTVAAFLCRTCYAMEVLSLPSSLTGKMEEGCFMTCVGVRRITIPTGVTELGRGAFQRCFAATLIQVPNTVVWTQSTGTGGFGDSCFADCYELRKINIPAGNAFIPSYFADNCHCLSEVSLPGSLLNIRNNAFSHCFALASLTIPSTVNWIYDFAFLYADGAAEIRMTATTPPHLEAHALTETCPDLLIYVPYSANHSVLNAYKAAANWALLADRIVEEAQ